MIAHAIRGSDSTRDGATASEDPAGPATSRWGDGERRDGESERDDDDESAGGGPMKRVTPEGRRKQRLKGTGRI